MAEKGQKERRILFFDFLTSDGRIIRYLNARDKGEELRLLRLDRKLQRKDRRWNQ